MLRARERNEATNEKGRESGLVWADTDQLQLVVVLNFLFVKRVLPTFTSSSICSPKAVLSKAIRASICWLQSFTSLLGQHARRAIWANILLHPLDCNATVFSCVRYLEQTCSLKLQLQLLAVLKLSCRMRLGDLEP